MHDNIPIVYSIIYVLTISSELYLVYNDYSIRHRSDRLGVIVCMYLVHISIVSTNAKYF